MIGWRPRGAAVTLAAASLSGCLAAAGRPAAGPVPRTHVVRIRSFTFVPADLTIAAGDSVAWINEDAFFHTAAADGGAWASPELPRGSRFSVAPRAPGAYPYHCAAHPTMRGLLNVASTRE